MKTQNQKFFYYLSLTIFALSCTPKQPHSDLSIQKKEVLPQHKQEVTAIYKECLHQEHGTMLQCIQRNVQKLGKDVNIFADAGTIQQTSNKQTSEKYTEKINNFPVNEINLNKGKEIYNIYCAVCHGADGQGSNSNVNSNINVANLTNPEFLKKSDGEIFKKITEGNWPMPTFWEGDLLNEPDIWVLIQYVRSLSMNNTQ